MQNQVSVCNLPKRLGGLSLTELRHLCLEHNIHRSKANNFLKTKRDICLALTLAGISKFTDQIQKSPVLHARFDNSPNIEKQQLDIHDVKNAEKVKTLQSIATDISKNLKKVGDMQDSLQKELVQFEHVDLLDDNLGLQNLRNRYHYKIQDLAQKARSLQTKAKDVQVLQEDIRSTSEFVTQQKHEMQQMVAPSANKALFKLKADVQRLKETEKATVSSLTELRDHVFRLKNEQASISETNTTSQLEAEMSTLMQVKSQLEASVRDLKKQMVEKQDGLSDESKSKINEYVTLLKDKDDEIKKISGTVLEMRRSSEADNLEITKLKDSLKTASVETQLLSKYQAIFPNIDDARRLFENRKDLEIRGQKMRDSMRSTEAQVSKLVERIDKMDDESSRLIRSGKIIDKENLELMFRRIDKFLDKYSDARRELASLQRQIKASDGKVKDFQSDFVNLLKMTDDKLTDDIINVHDRSGMIEKLKTFITNRRYLDKTVKDLDDNNKQTVDSLSTVAERMEKIGRMLDDSEQSSGDQLTGGGGSDNADAVLKTLDKFENRIKKLIVERQKLIKQINDLKDKAGEVNTKTEESMRKSVEELTAHNLELQRELQISQADFIQMQANLKTALVDLDKSSESDDSKFIKLKETVAVIIGLQTNIVDKIADIEARINHTDALQQTIRLDSLNKIIPEPILPPVSAMPQHEASLSLAAQELKISTKQKEEAIESILKHQQELESLNDAKQQNAGNSQEVTKLEVRITEIEQLKQIAVDRYELLEKSIAEKVHTIEKLQNELSRVQQQETERLHEIKAALEEAYMTQIHSKDDSLTKLSEQLRLQGSSEREALKTQESAMRTSSDARIQELTKQIDVLKQTADDEGERDANILIQEKSASLQREKELHEQFQKALTQKDNEMQTLKQSFQDRMKAEHDQLIKEDQGSERVDLQSHFLENMHSIEQSWRERYDKLNNEYEQLRSRYQTEIDNAREKALAFEADIQQKSSDKFLQYNEAIRKSELLEQQLSVLTERNQNLAGKAEEFMNSLIETKKELEKTKLEITDKRRLDQVIDQLNQSRDEFKDKEQDFKEKDKELQVAQSYIGRLQDKVEKNNSLLYQLKENEHAINVYEQEIQELHKRVQIEHIERQTFKEESNSLRSRLDDIKDAVKEFAGVRTINFRDSHKIMSPDTVAKAVQSVKDIVQDYRFFRSDYDKVVGKMRDNIVSIVKTLTNAETLDLASIDKRAAAAMTKDDAKAELQKYKAMMTDELRRESERRYEEAKLTAIAYDAEDKFHNETENDIYKIFESNRTPEFFNKKLEILNNFITYITTTRQRVQARASSVLKGDDETKKANIQKLRSILNEDLFSIEHGLSDLLRIITNGKSAEKKDIKPRLKYLIDRINYIHNLDESDLFEIQDLKGSKDVKNIETMARQPKAVQDFKRFKDAYVIETDAAISLLVQSANLSQADITSKALAKFVGMPPAAFNTVHSVLYTKIQGGAITNDVIIDSLNRVQASRGDFERAISFFLSQWEEINGKSPDLSNYSKTLSSLRKSNGPITATNTLALPQPSSQPSNNTSSGSSQSSSPSSLKDMRSYVKWLVDSLRNLRLLQPPGRNIINGNVTGDQIKKTFNAVIDYAIHAWVQYKVWGTLSGPVQNTLKSYYIDNVTDQSIANVMRSVTQDDIANLDKFELTLDDDNLSVQEVMKKLNDIKESFHDQTGGASNSDDDRQLLQRTLDDFQLLSEQRRQSDRHLEDLLSSAQSQLTAMMKLRPRRNLIKSRSNKISAMGGASSQNDDRIDVRSVEPYDVDKLNVVLEGLNKLIQTQMKEMKALRVSSREGKEFKERVEKLDRLLVEKDVNLEQIQEIMTQSVDRALTLEDELIKRDTVFERLKLVILGIRVDEKNRIYFDKSRNAFKTIKKEDNTIKFPQFIWESYITEAADTPIIKSSRGTQQIKTWFETVKESITAQMIFDVFEDAMTCQHYLGEADAFTSENLILTQVLRLKQDINDTLKKLSNDPYDDVYATIDDLKLLNSRWYQDVVSPQMRDGLMAFSNDLRSRLYSANPARYSRRSFETSVKGICKIALVDIQKLINIVNNASTEVEWITPSLVAIGGLPSNGNDSDRWNRLHDIFQRQIRNPPVNLSPRQLHERSSFLTSCDDQLSKEWESEIKSQAFPSLANNTIDSFKLVLTNIYKQLESDINKGFDEPKLMKSRRGAILAQTVVSDRFAVFDSAEMDFDYPDAANLDIPLSAPALEPGFFDGDEYPSGRVDSWVTLTTDLTNYPPSIQRSSRNPYWKFTANIGLLIDIIGVLDNDNSSIYFRLCSAVRTIACIFVVHDLSQMSQHIRGRLDDLNEMQGLLGSTLPSAILDPTGSRLKGFIPLLNALSTLIQSMINFSNHRTDQQKLQMEIKLLSQTKAVIADADIILNTLTTAIVGIPTAEIEQIAKTQMIKVLDMFDINLKKSFDEYLATWTREAQVGGYSAHNKYDYFVLNAFQQFFDQEDKLIPILSRVWKSFVGDKSSARNAQDLISLEEKDDALSILPQPEIRTLFDSLDEAALKDKLEQIVSLRNELQTMFKQENIPDIAQASLVAFSREMNIAETYLTEKLHALQAGQIQQDQESHQIATLTQESLNKDKKITELATENIQIKRQAVLSNSDNKVVFAYFKNTDDNQIDESPNNTTNEQSLSIGLNKRPSLMQPLESINSEEQMPDASINDTGPLMMPELPELPIPDGSDESKSSTESSLMPVNTMPAILEPSVIAEANVYLGDSNPMPVNLMPVIAEPYVTAEANVYLGDWDSVVPSAPIMTPQDITSQAIDTELNDMESRTHVNDFSGLEDLNARLQLEVLNERQKDQLLRMLNSYHKFKAAELQSTISNKLKAIKDTLNFVQEKVQPLTEDEIFNIVKHEDQYEERLKMIEACLKQIASVEETMIGIPANLEASGISNQIDVIKSGQSKTLNDLIDKRKNRDDVIAMSESFRDVFKQIEKALDAPLSLAQLPEVQLRLDEVNRIWLALMKLPDVKEFYSPSNELDPILLQNLYNKRLEQATLFQSKQPTAVSAIDKLKHLSNRAGHLSLPTLVYQNDINKIEHALSSLDPVLLAQTLDALSIDQMEQEIEQAESRTQEDLILKQSFLKLKDRFSTALASKKEISNLGLSAISQTTHNKKTANQIYKKIMQTLEPIIAEIDRSIQDIDKSRLRVSARDLDVLTSAISHLESELSQSKNEIKSIDDLRSQDIEKLRNRDISWQALQMNDLDDSTSRKVMMKSLYNVQTPFQRQKQQGGNSNADAWDIRLKKMQMVCTEIYTYIVQFFRLPSVLRLISTSAFCRELESVGVGIDDIDAFMHILFIDINDFPKEQTSDSLSTSKRFWKQVAKDSVTHASQMRSIGLDASSDSFFVRSDNYFKFVSWLLDQQSQAIMKDPEEYQSMLVHVYDTMNLWQRYLETNLPMNLLDKLKLSSMDAKHVEAGVSRILTYLRVRCDNLSYWNERFRLSWNKETRHELLLEFNNHAFPYYDHSRLIENTFKNVNDSILRAFGNHAGGSSKALKNNAPYEHQYLMGPLTNVFPPDMTTKDIATECHGIKQNLIKGCSVFVIGYGASGSGKTSTLICKSGSKDCGYQDSGVLLHLLQDQELSRQYPKIELTVHELFAGSSDPRSGDGLSDTKKVDDMAFVFSAAQKAYVFDPSTTYHHSANTSSTDINHLKDGIRRYSMPPANDEYYNDRYVNVVNSSLFSPEQDLQLTEHTTLSKVIKQALDDDRLTRATTNNPNSSRSHVLIFVKLIDELPGDAIASSPYLIVGDFAGVENVFACQDIDTLKKIFNQKADSGDRKYQDYMIQEDIALNAKPEKYLGGNADDFDLYADSKNPSIEEELAELMPTFQQIEYKQNDEDKDRGKSKSKSKVQTESEATSQQRTQYCDICESTTQQLKQVLMDYRKAIPFREEKASYLSLLKLPETDIYLNDKLANLNAEIEDPLCRSIEIIGALTAANFHENVWKVLKSLYPKNPKSSSDTFMQGTSLDTVADSLYEFGALQKQPMADIFGIDLSTFHGQKVPKTVRSAKYFSEMIDRIHTRLQPFLDHFKNMKNADQCVQCFMKVIIRRHFAQVKKRSDMVQSMVSVCKARTYEGIFINDSLAVIRDVMKKLIAAQSRDASKLRVTPPFPDLCLPLYCNPLIDECFQSSDDFDDEMSGQDLKAKDILKSRSNVSKSISSIIFDTLGESALELKIAVFCIFLMNRTANDPPPTPFIDGEDLRLEIARKNNRDSVLAMLGEKIPSEADSFHELAEFFNTERISPVKQAVIGGLEASIRHQRDLLGIATCDEMLQRISHGEWDAVMKMIDRVNATHPIGTLQFTDLMAKYSLTDFSCRITSHSAIPFAQEMPNSLINNMKQRSDELSAMRNMMEPKYRLSEFYSSPSDPLTQTTLDNHLQNVEQHEDTFANVDTEVAKSPVVSISKAANVSYPKQRGQPQKSFVKKVGNPILNNKKLRGGAKKEDTDRVVFDPQDFDELIQQWPDADGRDFSDFLGHAYMDRPTLVSKTDRSPRRPRRKTRKG